MWLRDIDRWFMAHVLPYAGVYRTYARRLMRDDSEAEDLVQEAYARVVGMENWQRLEAPHRFTLRVIHNLAVERIRHARVVTIMQAGNLEMAEWADLAPDPYSVIASRDELRRVLAALNLLPEKCREAMLLRKFHGLTPFQIAERMAISVSTVEKHLAKGLRLLTKMLANEDGQAVEDSLVVWRQSEKTRTPG